MRRYYSHYTYIYPDLYLSNHIVELDKEGRVSCYFPFEKEVEKTEFYSGVVLFLPMFVLADRSLVDKIKAEVKDRYLIDGILDVEIVNIVCDK